MVAAELILADQSLVVAQQALPSRDQLFSDRPDASIMAGQASQLTYPAVARVDGIPKTTMFHMESLLKPREVVLHGMRSAIDRRRYSCATQASHRLARGRDSMVATLDRPSWNGIRLCIPPQQRVDGRSTVPELRGLGVAFLRECRYVLLETGVSPHSRRSM